MRPQAGAVEDALQLRALRLLLRGHIWVHALPLVRENGAVFVLLVRLLDGSLHDVVAGYDRRDQIHRPHDKAPAWPERNARRVDALLQGLVPPADLAEELHGDGSCDASQQQIE